jgi:hypothetical protein
MSTNNQGVHVTTYVKVTEAEYLALLSQIKCLRARVEGIAAQIEDSEYFGKISPRGAPKLLTEIADSCRVSLDTVDGIARRSALPSARGASCSRHRTIDGASPARVLK